MLLLALHITLNHTVSHSHKQIYTSFYYLLIGLSDTVFTISSRYKNMSLCSVYITVN